MGGFVSRARPDRLLTLSAALIVFAVATITRADADLWGHLRFGLDFLRDCRLPSIDPYSFTQDVPWINHEWLSEAQMALAWTAARSVGLTILKALLVSIVVALVWSGLGAARLGVRAVAFSWLFFGTIHMWATLRPQLWTFVAFALLCRALVAERRGIAWWLPLLFAVWVNCHGGWIVGLGTLGMWAVGSVLRRPDERWRWLALVAASVIATLLNPYGWNLWFFMIRTVHMTRKIAEWEPLWHSPWINWVPWLGGVGVIGWGLSRARSVTSLLEPAPVVLTLAMLAFAAARVMRVESLFVVATLVLPARWAAARWPSRRAPWIQDSAELRTAALVGMVAASGLSVAIARRTTSCLTVQGDWAPDTASARALESAEPGRLVTYFDWGQFAIWHFGPRLKVSMDGRRETVYSDARLTEHDAIVAGRPEGLRALAGWDAEYVWLPASSRTTREWLAGHGYRIDVSGPRSFVAVRQDLPTLATQAPPRSADCFPE